MNYGHARVPPVPCLLDAELPGTQRWLCVIVSTGAVVTIATNTEAPMVFVGPLVFRMALSDGRAFISCPAGAGNLGAAYRLTNEPML